MTVEFCVEFCVRVYIWIKILAVSKNHEVRSPITYEYQAYVATVKKMDTLIRRMLF